MFTKEINMIKTLKLILKTVVLSCISTLYAVAFYKIFDYFFNANIGSGLTLTVVTLLLTGFFYSFVCNYKKDRPNE